VNQLIHQIKGERLILDRRDAAFQSSQSIVKTPEKFPFSCPVMIVSFDGGLSQKFSPGAVLHLELLHLLIIAQ
jgi:hypothetical protein